jgi:hypothetical protein
MPIELAADESVNVPNMRKSSLREINFMDAKCIGNIGRQLKCSPRFPV